MDDIIINKHIECDGNRGKLCIYDCQHCYLRSFASHKKVKMWSNDNGGYSPRQIMLGSDKIIEFICDVCNHIFSTQMKNVGLSDKGCAYCGNQRLCDANDCVVCYNKSFKCSIDENAISDGIIWSTKNKDDPRQLFKSSHKKYLFECQKCNHTFKCSLGHIHDRGCPFCTSKQLCNNENCQSCLDKSFKLHPMSKYLSDKKCDPRYIFNSSHKKYSFDCPDCDHSFECRIANMTALDRNCPYCCDPPQKLCESSECIVCFEKSVAGQWFSNIWSKDNVKTARQVFRRSDSTYIYDCNRCNHKFEASPDVMSTRLDNWCSYCNEKSVKICNDKNCLLCYNKTFASHEKSKYWSIKNKDKPKNIYKYSDEFYIFNCGTCNKEFTRKLSSVTRRNYWCPSCKHKTETKLLKWLQSMYNFLTIICQSKFDWCVNPLSNRKLPFDFFIKELNVFIELDGAQHFKQVSNWQSPENTQKYDIYKMKHAIKNNYTIIRLLQDDVWNDKNDWKQALVSHIKLYRKPSIIYICSNNEYSCYNLNLNIDEKELVFDDDEDIDNEIITDNQSKINKKEYVTHPDKLKIDEEEYVIQTNKKKSIKSMKMEKLM